MNTSARIRSHINSLSDGQPFSTRDLLEFGRRASIDQMTHILVKLELLVRLARGVFMKPTREGVPRPSAQKIAEIKARAFGKEIYTQGADAAHLMRLTPTKDKSLTFTVSGRTTSFLSIHGRITFCGTTAKDVRKGNNAVGLIVRAIKHLGRHKLTMQVVERVMYGLMRTERNKLRRDVKWMPAWMGDEFVTFWYGSLPNVTAA